MKVLHEMYRILHSTATRLTGLSGVQIGALGVALVVVLSAILTLPARAAIAYRNFSTVENGAGATTLALTTPANTAAGDVMIAVITVRGGTGVTITPPSNWTQKTTNNSTTVLKSATFSAEYSVVGAGPYTFTFSSSQKAAAVVISYSGVDSVDAVGVTGSQANASGTTMTAPSITTLVPNTMLVGLYGNATGTTFAAGSSMTLRGQATSSGGGQQGTKVTTGVQDVVQAAAASTGTKTMTASNAAVSIGHLLSLRPAPNISQVSYRFFQNADSTTASTVLAAKDSPASVEKDTPFRLRLNLGIASGGTNMSAVASRTFKIQYALKSGTCGAYADVTAATVVRFYNNATPADGAAYVANATNDPIRAGITPVSQKYHENNPFSVAANTPANQDALWDVSLTTSGASFGETYCFRVVYASDGSELNGGYTVTPELTILTPTVGQANYRFFANLDSITPGSSLTTSQDTAASLVSQTSFRLRQRLAVGASQLPASNQNYKLQYAEKSGVCDAGFSGESYADISGGGSSGSISGYAASASDDGSAGVVPWTNVASATGLSDSVTATASTDSVGVASTRLVLTNFGLNVPTGATITGITVRADRSSLLDPGTSADEFETRLIKAGVIQGESRSRASTAWANAAGDWGGSADLWGSTWTPADINASNFGVSLSVGLTGDPTFGNFASANVDSVQITVAYTVAGGSPVVFSDNVSVASPSTIASITGDPTNGARPTVYQSYRETDPFTNNVAALPSGSDGLWDFALTSSSAAAGKTYCLRVVKSDGNLLDSYSQIPEISFSAPAGPTLDQQLRGGAGVVNGTKSPLVW